MIPCQRIISQSARSEILRLLRSLRLNLIGNWYWHSALASLGVFASLWVANPRKGRLRLHFLLGNILHANT